MKCFVTLKLLSKRVPAGLEAWLHVGQDDRKFEEVVKSAQNAAVLVVVYY